MLRGRTKALFAVSLLAPASVLVDRIHKQRQLADALQQGARAVRIDPGLLLFASFIVGLLSLALAIVFATIDLYRNYRN
jgi:hypothetical protein